MRRLVPWLVLLLSCRPMGTDRQPEPGPTEPRRVVEEQAAPQPVASTDPEPEPAAPVHDPVLVVTDRPTLAALQGLSFAEVVLGHPAASTAALSNDPAFASITRVIAADLRRDGRDDPKAGVGTHNPHRQFDRRWLDRDDVRLDLVAVVNRLDRHPFAPDHCGETRLIYRLAYDASLPEGDVSSRLPMTFNVVSWQDGATCGEVARRWLAPVGQDAKARATWLQSEAGPLAARRLAPDRLKAVEIDMQSVRWPSAVRPRMAGHAEYTLRVFHRDGERFVPAKLENTPDVARLRRSRALRQELLAWLKDPDNVPAIDDGVPVIPDRFLAERGLSVTPRGFARLSNRPFSQLYTAEDFSDLELSSLRHASSPSALLRRLDGLSCGGCHESRSVAGFHIVGEDPPDQALDAVAVPISPHLAGDLARRKRYLLALAGDEEGSNARPLSERDARPGAWGTHCSLAGSGSGSGSGDWSCAEGLRCRALGDPEMGVCINEGAPGAGGPCEVGTVRPVADPHRDWATNAAVDECANGAFCNDNAVGFPEGMCTSGCSDLAPGETCGAIVSLRPFNACVAKRRPFTACIEENAFPAGMRACDVDHPCRDDYICARSPFGEPSTDHGACLPPYFLFQLRVDGHVM